MSLHESILNILHEELYNVDFNESLTGITPTGTTQQLINKPVKLIGDVNTTTIIKNVTGDPFFEGQLTDRLREIGNLIGPHFRPVRRP